MKHTDMPTTQHSTSSAPWPLTEAQSGLWYAQRLEPDNPSFNTGHALWIEGALDIVAFTNAANQAAQEAQSLSLIMRDGPQGPVQWLEPLHVPRLECVDWSHHAQPAAQVRASMLQDMQTPTDPCRVPLARQCLYVLGPQTFVWYQRAHHLANDGYGMALWGTRVGELYAAHVAGAAQHAALVPLQGLMDEDAAYQGSERRIKDAAFWRQALTPMPEVVGMSSPRAISAHTCHRLAVALPPDLMERLLAYAQTLQLPWPDVLTAITAVYVQRMSGATQTVVGVPYMGRLGSVGARATATVMNVLPLCVTASPQTPVAGFIQALAREQMRARRHGRYRSEQLRRDLGLLGGQRRLYGALINVQPFYRPLQLPGVRTELEILGTGPIDDITIGFRGDGVHQLDLEIEANPDLYSAAAVQAHQQRLLAFLRAAITAATVGDIPLASPEETQRYLFDVNATDHQVPDTTLAALIEASMVRTPDAVALEYEDAQLTYAQLEERSRSLALALQQRGVGRGALVVVALPRSLELLVALVGILRAGAAYLPLDLSHPSERLARIVSLAQPVCALVQSADTALLPEELACFVPQQWPVQSAGATVPHAAQPQDTAYVIYTSGSTGEPKGVVVEHRAIVNRLEWMRQHYGFDASDRILQKTPATFDVSVWEFFLPLITGCTLVIAPPQAHRDPSWLAAIIRQRQIGTCHFVPSMLAAFLADPGARGLCMRRIFCSGEELPAPLRDRLHATLRSELHNLYGPTEAAVDVSYWPADVGDDSVPVPIGYPVWNTRLYVLDAHMRPLPPGVAGDLYLGGAQLARGYLGRDDLTAERFLADPFRPGERIYQTGDLARWREDGALVFLGRSDHQIKLRGLRIELGDIEAAIAASGMVTRVGVIVREDRSGDKRLVAYVQPGPTYDVKALRGHVAVCVPDYMVPAAFVALYEWPVTSNGKLDRNRLPAPSLDTPERATGPLPQTSTEMALAQLFVQVLKLDTNTVLGTQADFFSLGGDSLLAVELLLVVQEHWQRNPGLGTLFAAPTLGAIAAAIDAEEVRFDSGLAPVIQLAAGDPVQPMLFVIHPAGGIAWGYRHLARALAFPAQGTTRSVFGLQSPALNPDEPLPQNIDALARQYVARVQELQPNGPVHLLGWSVGGIIAQAMAVELQEQGRTVGLVALLDAYPADVWRAEPEPTALQALRALLAVAGHDPEGHPELTTREAVVDFLRQGGTALGHLPERALEGVVRVVTDTNRLIRQHHHRRFDGTLTHVRAACDHADKPQLQAECWLPYAARLDTLQVPLLHAQMTGEQATALMAQPLLQRLG